MSNNEANVSTFAKTIELSTLQKAYFMGRRPDFDFHVHTHLYIQHKFENKKIDPDRLEKALNTVLAAYDILSARVTPEAKIQIPDRPCPQNIQVHNLTALDKKAAQEHCGEICEWTYRSNFDIQTGNNIEISVIQMADSDVVQINFNLMLLDGFSIRKILHELSALYDGDITSLEPKPFNADRYEKYTIENRNSERYKRTLGNWMQQLDTFPSGPIFPTKQYIGKPRRSELTRRKHFISPDHWNLLTQKAGELAVTPTALVLAAFSLILSFWSKNLQFSITMLTYSVRGKNIPELEEAVGNFASTALIKFDYQSEKTLETMAKDTHKELFLALTKSMVCGLDVLQEINRSEHSTFRAPSPVAFVSMINDQSEKGLPGVFQLEGDYSMRGGLETPQVLFDHQAISRPDGGVSLIWDTMDFAFEESVIEDMFAAYTGLIDTMVSDNAIWQQKHFDFRSKSQIENHTRYNATEDTIVQKCLHELFYEQVERTPNNIYLMTRDEQFTYENVRNNANKLASVLRFRENIVPNELIAIYTGKGWQQPLAALAILIAGAAYVPIDPKQPLQRKVDILKRCACRVVLTTAEHMNDAALNDVIKIDISAYRDCEITENLQTAQKVEDTAYVIFTSGSTGTPKGVTLDNLGPVNTVLDINKRIQIKESDVVFGLSELNFDLSVYDIFGVAAAGATLFVPPDGAGRDPALCLQLVHRHQVTIWNSVPALADLLMEYIELTHNFQPLPIRTYMLSGDWIHITLPGKLKKYGEPVVLSLGGATEASIWSIYYPVEEVDPNWKSIPYGYPLTNQTFFVLDDKLQQRPDNVAGELYIGGIGVAKNYYGDTEKTNKAYIVHPTTGARLYRAGDWGVMRPAGHIDFLGRQDGQVKVRGHRIELGEIEAVLQRHPKMQNAVVKVIGNNPHDAYIAAYWVADPESDLTESEVVEFLAAYVPNYMIPSQFIQLEHLPLGATGKVDRKALPNPERKSDVAASNPPQTATEILLADCWKELLGIQNVNQNDNFFELGGNSFAAVRLMAAIHRRFKLELPVTALVETPRLDQLAASLDAKGQGYQQVFSHLVPLSKNAAKPSCFLFHPSGGSVLCYQELAKKLASDFNVVGVQAHPGRAQEVFGSFEEMTECYVQQLKRQQPQGPYYLGGWSMGGVIAYAAAQQLIENGETVAALWMLDSPFPTAREIPNEGDLLKWFISDITQRDTLPHMTSLEMANPILSSVISELQVIGLLDASIGSEFESIFACFCANIKLLHKYVATPLNAIMPILLAMASEQVEERVSQTSGADWLKFLADFKVRHLLLNTNHYGMVGIDSVGKIVPEIEVLLA